MMHNAACIAAIAFSNASVGVNHALAHAFGARFGVAHGRANALMLPHVIAYNAAVPTKFMPSPNQRGYTAHKKYAMVADLLGLGGETIEEKVRTWWRRRSSYSTNWRFRVPSPTWEFRRKNSSGRCPIWSRLPLTILRGARTLACHC